LRIAVVTPAFNVARYVGDAVRSVLGQTHRDFRMVVVDDGSTDGTESVVAGFTDPRLSLIRQENAGVSVARNRGIAAVGGQALLFLDADDWLAPKALALLADTLAGAPDTVAAVGGYARVGLTTPPANRVFQRIPAESRDLLPRLLVRNQFANGGHLLIRRDALRHAGWFRPDLHYGEDWECWVRLGLQGRFAIVPERPPLLFVRSREEGAYRRMAADPDALRPCVEAIFGNPALMDRFGPVRLAKLRRLAEAENHWVVGRELVRQGHAAEGRSWLRRSVAAAPGAKRAMLLAAAQMLPLLPVRCRGPFRPYAPTTTQLGGERGKRRATPA